MYLQANIPIDPNHHLDAGFDDFDFSYLLGYGGPNSDLKVGLISAATPADASAIIAGLAAWGAQEINQQQAIDLINKAMGEVVATKKNGKLVMPGPEGDQPLEDEPKKPSPKKALVQVATKK